MAENDLAPGRATPEGTRRFAARFPDLPGHFRRPDRLTLSSLALGTRNGERGGGADDMLYRSAVERLLEGGVNVFATALSDRMHASERAVGIALQRAFREGVAARDEIVVVSKAGYITPDPDARIERTRGRYSLREIYVDTGLVDPEHVVHGVHCLDGPFLRHQLEQSQRNLRLETIDLYLLEEPELQQDECGADEFRRRMQRAFEALERAVQDGLIGAYGLSTWAGLLRPHTERSHLAILDIFDWALEVGGGDHHLRALQLPYSVAMGEALRLDSQIGPAGRTQAVLATLRGTGTTVLASAPLVQGRALGKLPEGVPDALPGLRSDAQRCLQFVRSTPGITSAVVGMRDPDHIEENLEVAAVPPVGPEILEALFKQAVR